MSHTLTFSHIFFKITHTHTNDYFHSLPPLVFTLLVFVGRDFNVDVVDVSGEITIKWKVKNKIALLRSRLMNFESIDWQKKFFLFFFSLLFTWNVAHEIQFPSHLNLEVFLLSINEIFPSLLLNLFSNDFFFIPHSVEKREQHTNTRRYGRSQINFSFLLVLTWNEMSRRRANERTRRRKKITM